MKNTKEIKGVIKRKYSFVHPENGCTVYKFLSDSEYRLLFKIINLTQI